MRRLRGDTSQEVRSSNLIINQPSLIKEVNDNLELIAEWMGVSQANIQEIGDYSAVYLKNVYRGSHDGYSQKDFFERVRDKTHTIFFCQAAGSNYVFGGFNKIGYKLLSNEAKTNVDFQDESAFIFSVTHRTKHIP